MRDSTRRIHRIAAEVAGMTGIPARAIVGQSRVPDLVAARHLVWFRAHRDGMSFAEIGRATGRDHTSIMHGVRKEAQIRGQA